MSSTASRQSQDPLHLQRQGVLYAVDMTIGKKINRARKARKLSLEKLGSALGVSRQLVWQWERDRSDPRTHIEGLSRALEMPVEYFYDPSPTDGPIEAKIKRLSPAQQDLIVMMIDKMIGQIDEEISTIVKRA
jgi:transcriptional regulator with XRE-family HTH domain